MAITIFNRCEVLLTRDLTTLNKFTENLSKNGIEYKIATNSMTNPGRTHGIPWIRAEYAYEYRVYISRKDYKERKDKML